MELDVTAFAQAVYEMRKAQKAYFSLPTGEKMKDAKGKEARVDEWTRRLIDAGAIIPDAPAKQQNLF